MECQCCQCFDLGISPPLSSPLPNLLCEQELRRVGVGRLLLLRRRHLVQAAVVLRPRVGVHRRMRHSLLRHVLRRDGATTMLLWSLLAASPPPSALRGCIDGDGGLKHCALEGLRPRRERHSPYQTRQTGSGLLLMPSESAKTNTLLLVSQEWDKSGPNPGGRAALSGLAVLPPTLCGGR